jgi:hypothetical protein
MQEEASWDQKKALILLCFMNYLFHSPHVEWYCVGRVVSGMSMGLSDTRRVVDTKKKERASLVVASSFIEPNLPTYDLSIFLIIS